MEITKREYKQLQELWYQSLIDDCEAIITETVFTGCTTGTTGPTPLSFREVSKEGYHSLGKRILIESEKFGDLTMSDIATHVAKDVGKSKRTIQRAIQFARRYPDLDELPGGKNISWHKICNNLLPTGTHKVAVPSYIRYLDGLDRKQKIEMYSKLHKEFRGLKPDEL